MNKQELMNRAIALAEQSVELGGGPFGAVIARNGEIVAEAANRVTLDTDPTAHAEVSAIRLACKKLGRYNLDDCEIYSSCEPCPMCLGAIYWARLRGLYLASTRKDAARAGFDDDLIYNEIPLPPDRRRLPTQHLIVPRAAVAFNLWEQKANRADY